MFWKFNLLTTSRIETLLDKEDVTLHELMDEDDILQECKAQNRKLITFLVLPENMDEMVKLITQEPEDDMEDKVKYKFPNTACELLTSDVSQINDALAGSDELIRKLYGFLDADIELNPLLASFFSKVMGLLITRKSEMILEFLKSREDFVGTLLRHIGTSAIMDLLLRLLTCIESPEIRRAMVEWLNEENIVKKLVNSITVAFDEDIHCNAAQSLCDIIRLGREQVLQLQDRAEPDPLLTAVEKEETVSQLLDNMLSGEKNESVIVNGLSVIQTLLEFNNKQGPEDSVEQLTVSIDPERMFNGVKNVLTAICPRLKDFHSILVDPPKQRFEVMPTTAGSLDPPLGNTRLQTCRLISSLLSRNNHEINIELAQLGTIGLLLELYFKYTLNNFLHTHVAVCLYTILNNPPIDVEEKKECPLLDQLFSDIKIIQKILDEWEINDQEQSKDGGGHRRGYMGHLTKSANDIVNAIEKLDHVKELTNDLPKDVKERWENFVANSLADMNKKNTVELVRGGHPLASSSEDDDADFRDIPFPQDTAMQQAFSDYQLQQMTSNFIDQFGFNEEEFGEQEEKTDSPFGERISSIDFSVSVNDDTRPNTSMFEQSCNERLQQFDNDSDEDIWEEKEITFSPSTPPKRQERLHVARSSHDSDDSTDSEEELDSPKRIVQQPAQGEHMDVDSSEAGWTANFEDANPEGGPVAMDTSPWDTSAKEPQEKWAELTNKVPEGENKDNWADFSSFSNISSIETNPRSSSPVDMDTTEESSRTNAYLADKKEPDLTVQSIDSTDTLDIDNKTPDTSVNTDASSDQQNSEVSSTTDSTTEKQTKDSQENQSTESPVHESSVGSPMNGASTQSPKPEPSSSPPDKPPAPPSEPPPDDLDDLPQSPSSPSSTPSSTSVTSSSSLTACDSTTDTASLKLGQGDGFLTKAGLMRSAAPPNCKPPESIDPLSEIQGNGPTNDNTAALDSSKMSQVEEIRAQAKDALDSYDNAIVSGASVQNGPV